MPTTLPRHILLLPLLFLLGFLYPWQMQHHTHHNIYAIGAGAAEAARPATQGKSDATQQWASAIIGAVAGGGTGASTGLQGEKFNRQLHQMEIRWIQNHIGVFGGMTGLSPENARKLLTLSAMTLVDGKMALANKANIQALLDQGFTQAQVAYAQQYLRSNTHGETFHNEFADRDEELFTVQNPVEYLSSYDPNKPAAGQIIGDIVTDAAGSAAAGALLKGVGTIAKIGGKYYKRLKNGKFVEVPESAVVKGKDGRPSWRDSEKDELDLRGEGAREQVSYKDGVEVPCTTAGCVKPDIVHNNTAIEVKNYDLNRKGGESSLVNTVAKQVNQRCKHLPCDISQEVVIDVRGQDITDMQRAKIMEKIIEKNKWCIKARRHKI